MSPQAEEVLRLIRFLQDQSGAVTTKTLADLRGTRTGPTNRILQRLKRRGYVALVNDPPGDKGARQWRVYETKNPGAAQS